MQNNRNELYETVTHNPYEYDFDCAMPYPPFIDSNQPTYEDNWEPSYVETIFIEKIPIVHKLSESVIDDLQRYILFMFCIYIFEFRVLLTL